ncbi:uncharacterized protein FOMMEDRAFT_116159 [Fomitiporia mediterranea MF3/22]|uniref:uncharacterized protein n=1 Tax=Fomitiporia mediterranea (strain MF3/22) TaxID=694068 RepID=UPI0004408737|nr:uncharacterized protein FOMMEDRAFT_116159 [Fomitiporia mediterranea MF3/22]EJD07749.1 hypothetical protein FOMMEDRAFT_116159 [Fomitiporia mediterranea MF3/22]
MNGGRALPPGAAPLNPQEQLHNQGQVPTRQGAYPTSRRYSGGAHRRSASGAAVPAATALASTTAAGVGEVVVNQEMEKGHAADSGSETLAPGPRTKKAAPPSSYRGSRTSFSGPGTGSSTNVAEDAHPLSPNPSEDPNSPHPNTNVNGEAPSSVGHGSIVSATSNQNISAAAAAAMYAHQYPHSPVGYQYPPSPPPVGSPVSPHAAYVSVPGAGYTSTMPGYTPTGQPIVYPNVPAPGHFVNGIPVGGSGYATPVPRGPPPHNAFMVNSAIARSSLSASVSGSAVDLVPYAARMNGTAVGQSRRNSIDVGGFAPPQPPFAQGAYPPSSPGTPGTPELRHAGSLPRLREPFLSPASRRSSTVWQPPTPAMYTASNVGYEGGDGRGGSGFFGGYGYNGVGSGSNTMLALPGKKEPLPSSALQRKISMSEKPWMRQRQKGERAAWWVTFCIMWIGIAVGAVVIFFGFSNVEKINRPLCSVLDENFNTFDTNTWTKNVSLGGFGNGEFQMTTDSSDNLYIKNGELYIMPTLTSDEIGASSIFDGYTYNLTGCTETWNASACNVRSDQGTNTVVNPVKSARISTQNSVSMAYGKVEVRAKMPRGDWLWPAIWMLPKDEKYGAWPRSGEIDIVEARGNSASYPRQGNNFVRGSLNWGPLDTVVANAFGWQFQKRSTYSSGFHTYTLEWTPDFIRISVDSKLRAMLDLNIKKTSFWERGGFPVTAQNGSTQAVVQDIWEGQPNAAPFDQEFYLIIDLAVGGTSGWFPDNVGGKMWFDGSATAMTDFAKAQDTWSATWPSSDDDRALRVDSVKMWKLC